MTHLKSLNPGVQRLVICSAVKDKATGTMVCGARHGDCLWHLHHLGFKTGSEFSECGFVDQDNVFMTRSEAWTVADMAGQIRRPTGLERDYDRHRPANVGDTGLLFSENLY